MLPAATQSRPIRPLAIEVILAPLKKAALPSAAMMASCRHFRSGSPRSSCSTIASGAVPRLRCSRILGPSRGSVRCCVRTAPIPASAQAQRLPTAMAEVVTTAPSIPVLAQRPAIEKVMSADIPLRAFVAQPQPDQQAPALGVVEVAELGAAVADLAVGDELDLAGLQVEAELQRLVGEHFLDRLDRRCRLVVHGLATQRIAAADL